MTLLHFIFTEKKITVLMEKFRRQDIQHNDTQDNDIQHKPCFATLGITMTVGITICRYAECHVIVLSVAFYSL
jgi:hypothetical protein